MENSKRDNVKSVRFTDEELRIIEEYAKKSDRKTADFIRIATLRYIEISENTKR